MKGYKKLIRQGVALALSLCFVSQVSAFSYNDMSAALSISNYEITEVAPDANHISLTAWDSSGLQNINAIEFDPQNPYTSLRAGKSAGYVYSAQTVNTMANNMSDLEGDVAVAAVNGDFFDFGVGVPHGIFIDEGIILSTPPQYYAAFGLTYDNEPFIVRHGTILDKEFRINGILCDITGINNAHANGKDSLMLYTADYARGTKTGTETYELRCRVDSGEVKHGDTLRFTVEEVFDAVGNTSLGDGYIVLSAQGSRIEDLKKLSVGETHEISFRFNEFWSNVKFAVGGIELLLKDGEIYSTTDTSRQPRTSIGIRPDGTVVMATFDGRQKDAVGMSYQTAAEAMRALGCVDALNLDGGGSTTFVLRHPGYAETEVVNKVSGTSPRQVANALVLMNTAPTMIPTRLALTPKSRDVLIGGIYDFDVVGAYDENYKPSKVPEDIEWYTDSIGDIDEKGAFYAAEPGTFTVEAFSGRASGSAHVTVYDVLSEIKTDRPAIKADPGETITLSATAIVDGKEIESTPDLFAWDVPEEVGIFTEPGVLTVSETAISGEVTISYGYTAASVRIELDAPEVPEEPPVPEIPPRPITEFEGDEVAFVPVGISTKVAPNWKYETEKELVYDGLRSLKVYYNFLNTEGSVGSYYMISPESADNSAFKVAELPKKLGMFVYGDGSGVELRSILEGVSGQQYHLSYGKIEHTGWQYMDVAIPEGITEEVYIKVPVHLVSNPEKLTQGCLYFDKMRAVYSDIDDDMTAPHITKAWPDDGMLTYGRTPSLGIILADDASKIVPESVELVVNGWDCPDRTFDEATGKVAYTIKLPLKDGFHTVFIRARDERGNLLAKEWKFEVR